MEQHAARTAAVGSLGDRRQPLRDRCRAFERALVCRLVSPRDVEGLGAVRERVQRRADGLSPRQLEREVDLVDDRG